MWPRVPWVVLVGCLSSCAVVGPTALRATRARYNETIRATGEEEMLLNIVRLRYGETPSSLAVSSIAAQFEVASSLGASPFFTASADPSVRVPFPTVLPQAGVSGADRPTFSFTPLDDSDFARRLFTPLSLEGAVYLARTTWPIATVFRLYLENLNWVPNAQTASGPTPATAPPPSAFLEGIDALQALQQQGAIVFGTHEVVEPVSGVLPVASVTAQAAVAAAEQGLQLSPDASGAWRLTRSRATFTLHLDPRSLDSVEARTFVRVFQLAPGLTEYEVTVDGLEPFASRGAGLRQVDLETRSLLQALYFVSHGVDVPREHLEAGLARTTRTAEGKPFDWSTHLGGLFRVRSRWGGCGGAEVAVGVEYRGGCFYLAVDDHDSRATFTLLVELARQEIPAQTSRRGPLLTLPLGR